VRTTGGRAELMALVLMLDHPGAPAVREQEVLHLLCRASGGYHRVQRLSARDSAAGSFTKRFVTTPSTFSSRRLNAGSS